MREFNLKSLLPHLLAIVIFVALPLAYFSPLLEGKQLEQHDIAQWTGMSKEIADYREQTGIEPLWTNSMFGGMPAYQISVVYASNMLKYVDKIMTLGLPSPASFIFLYLLGFYFLLITMGVDHRLAIGGAIAFAFSSYLFIIIGAGHNSKAHAIGYMAPVIAGVIMTFRGRYLAGGAIAALALGLQIYANHLQITYYLMLILIIYGVAKAVDALRTKQLAGYTKAVAVLAVAVVLAVSSNITSLWATYEYGKDSTRGPSELTEKKSSDGLDKDYALGWSYGVLESFTLMLPDFMGGASQTDAGIKSDLYKTMIANGAAQNQARSIAQNAPLYWGEQPFTAGPTYFGILVVCLFILALFIKKGYIKWWLLVSTLLTLMLSWGKNFLPLTDLFFDYFPGYNKFRAVSMILTATTLTSVMLAWLAVKQLVSENITLESIRKPFYMAFGGIGAMLILFLMVPTMFFSFTGTVDEQLGQWPDWLRQALIDERIAILRFDIWRALAIMAIFAGALWMLLKKKISVTLFAVVLALLMLVDHWTIDKRYLNDSHFVAARKATAPFQPTQADQAILQDADPNFRVMNVTVSTFNDASTSYFHKSIGGYHGAKLKRYQELIEYQISQNNQQVLNMLNTKYFIVKGENQAPVAQRNAGALGNAWFVNKIDEVENADAEIAALTEFDPAKSAIVDKRFADYLAGLKLNTDTPLLQDTLDNPEVADDVDRIILKTYTPNHLTYETNTTQERLAVFSEIFYDKGWNAYIDGQQVPHIRVNYVLRAMRVPSGKHTLEYKFEPSVYMTGERISMASSLLLILISLGALGMQLRSTTPKG